MAARRVQPLWDTNPGKQTSEVPQTIHLITTVAPIITHLLPLLALLTPALSTRTTGCGKSLPNTQQPAGRASHQTSFTPSNGASRTYLIHIPSSYNPNTAVPLIFSYHGRHKDSYEQETLSQFSNESWNSDAIAAYPQGIDGQWQRDPDSTSDNLAFTSEWIAHFEDRYYLDNSRIYAAGKSNGGGFTGMLVCDPELSTQITAFAPVTGAFYVQGSTEEGCAPSSVVLNCSPGRKEVPILEFHGFNDTTIPYAGGPRRGECLPSVQHWVREWSKMEGFGLTNVTTRSQGGNVWKSQYGCGSGKQGIVTHYLINNLANDWPSTEPSDDNTNGTYINATPIILEFFKKYKL